MLDSLFAALPPTDRPTEADLALAYRVACRSRVLEEQIVRLAARGDVKFAIWGPGEEIHGVATALALKQVVKDVSRFGMVPHYRSGALIAMWSLLNGHTDFARDVLRQQFSKATDRMTLGRQMVNHLDIQSIGVLPVQSPVGMQLGKAAGYAMGFRRKGITDGITVGIVGDGTTAEGDMHDAMNAASVWSLPFILMVTDNGVAISTRPEDGRGIKRFSAYAEGFGVRFFHCDGRDFVSVYTATLEAARYARDEQKPVLLHVHDLPRFNGHSSAADMTFDLSQDDPLIQWGETLVQAKVLTSEDVLKRIPGEGRDFFAHHDLGQIAGQENESITAMMREVRGEPDPEPESILRFVYPPFPEVVEPPHPQHTTAITYGGAIRAAIDALISDHQGMVWGQDVAALGGVMQATAGVKRRHPKWILDAPLNEPLIVGTAMGMGLHRDVRALPEIQFGDYSLNAFHWLVHLGNLYWCSAGNSTCRLILRMPVDPFGGGAVYHSMSLDGYFTPIPGLVILMPATSWDAYGLLMTAATYDGPVVVLEPKWMYRQYLGPAFPNEPTDPEAISALKKSVMRGEIPEISGDVRVPFGKGAIRRAGRDVTIVSWGRAVWTSLSAAQQLQAQGVDAEVIDLRTLVPPDMELIAASVARTGRLVVAAEDRAFAGYVRTIQGHMVERFPGLPTRALGQRNLPGIAQNIHLEEYAVLNAGQICDAALEVMGQRERTPLRFFL